MNLIKRCLFRSNDFRFFNKYSKRNGKYSSKKKGTPIFEFPFSIF